MTGMTLAKILSAKCKLSCRYISFLESIYYTSQAGLIKSKCES
jgi:hypothetical protein